MAIHVPGVEVCFLERTVRADELQPGTLLPRDNGMYLVLGNIEEEGYPNARRLCMVIHGRVFSFITDRSTKVQLDHVKEHQ